jgi:hypothetical protein
MDIEFLYLNELMYPQKIMVLLSFPIYNHVLFIVPETKRNHSEETNGMTSMQRTNLPTTVST